MKRGILELTKSEMLSVIDCIDLQRYSETPLANKVLAGKAILTTENSVRLELSEEELEVLLDEVGLVIGDVSLQSVKKKMNSMMSNFRN